MRPYARGRPTEQPAVARGRSKPVVLKIEGLKTYFFTYEGVVRALDGVDLEVRGGEVSGIVGETGCGKSVTAYSVARLVGDPGRVVSGRVLLQGANVLWGLEREAKFRRARKGGRVKVIRSFRRIRLANERMSAIRGKQLGFIFQEPMQAMNPVFSISSQLGEALMLHRGVEIVTDLLDADRAWRRGEGALWAEAARRTSGPVSGKGILSEAEPAAPTLPSAGDSGSPLEDAIDKLANGVLGPKESGDARAAATKLGELVGLKTIGTRAFYQTKSATSAVRARARIVRIVRGIRLNPLHRSYLRHLRRLALLEQRIQEVQLKEMRLETPMRSARARVGLKKLGERATHFYFRLWGLHRWVERPLRNELMWRTVDLLEGVRIANPVQVVRGYPHELSGGMLQRVMIAMALSSNPAVLLADEPTTALDVTIQAQILELINHLKTEFGAGIVLITHDLGVVAETCDRVNVMYAGLIIESAPVGELFRRPLHPYTQGLLASIPRFDNPDKELKVIPGSVPNLIHPPSGCRFHPRCPYAMPICTERKPVDTNLGDEHKVACHLYAEDVLNPPVPEPAPIPEGVPAAPDLVAEPS